MDRVCFLLFGGQVTTLLVSPEDLGGESVEVRGEAYRHLFRSRRLAVGDKVRVVDGRGHARASRIESVTREHGRLALGPELPSLEPSSRLEILSAPPEPARAEWLVEKATELGAVAVRFVLSERSSRDSSRIRLERLERLARAAVEQCGRARLPEISGPHGWSELATLLAPLPRRWMLDPGPPEETTKHSGEPVALLVGPEGGWSDAERAHLRDLGCQPLHLGERILRTETAALAASAGILLSPPLT